MARLLSGCALVLASCTFAVEALPPLDGDGASSPVDLAAEDLVSVASDLEITAGDLTQLPVDLSTLPPVLSGSRGPIAGTTSLSSEGIVDWGHYGRTAVADVNHKGGISPLITVTTSATLKRFASYSRSFAWSGGATGGNLVATESGTAAGTYMDAAGALYTIVVPADTSTRTLRLYTLCFRGSCALRAHLSDGSAPDYNDTVTNDSGGTYAQYTLTYRAGSAPRNLTVTWTFTDDQGSGSLDLLATTLF